MLPSQALSENLSSPKPDVLFQINDTRLPDNNGILSEFCMYGTFEIILPRIVDVTSTVGPPINNLLVTGPPITHPCNESINISNYPSEPASSFLYQPDCLQVFKIPTLIQNHSPNIIVHRTLKSYDVHGGNVTDKSRPDASVTYDSTAYKLSRAQKDRSPGNNRVAHDNSTAYQPYHESFPLVGN